MRSWLGLIYTGKHARISRSCMISSRYKGYTLTEWPLIMLIQCWSYGQLNNLRKGRRIVFQSWGAMEHWKVLWATMVGRQEKFLNSRSSGGMPPRCLRPTVNSNTEGTRRFVRISKCLKYWKSRKIKNFHNAVEVLLLKVLFYKLWK